jgi:hypothetical protein
MVAPALTDTLVAVSAFDKLGYYTVYGDSKVIIADSLHLETANIVATGYLRSNNLYYFDTNESFAMKAEPVVRGERQLRSGRSVPMVYEQEINTSPTMPQSEEVNLPESVEDVKGDNHLPDQIKEEDQPVDKSLQRRQTTFDKMQQTLGLSKQSLVRLIKSNAVARLPLKQSEVNDLDQTNSLTWYQGHMKAFNRTRGENKDYLPLEKVGTDRRVSWQNSP